MDLEALAMAVDERVRFPAAERGSGRLYAVRCDPEPAGRDDEPLVLCDRDDGDDDDDPAGAGRSRRVLLELVAEGEARTLPQKVRLPEGLQAIALASGVWAAPLEEEGVGRPPSQHPDRRRAHLTVVVGTEGGLDGVDVSVLRYGDGHPTVLRGGVGLIHQRMVRCWSRRPDAPWASRRADRAA